MKAKLIEDNIDSLVINMKEPGIYCTRYPSYIELAIDKCFYQFDVLHRVYTRKLDTFFIELKKLAKVKSIYKLDTQDETIYRIYLGD